MPPPFIIQLSWSLLMSAIIGAYFNSLRPRQNGCHFADDIFNHIFLNKNVWISIKISLKFVPKGPIDNIAALVQIMAWRRPGDKPLSEPRTVSLPTHICITRPQWVKFMPQSSLSQGRKFHINGLVQERCNSSTLAMELRLSCINLSIWFRESQSCVFRWLW